MIRFSFFAISVLKEVSPITTSALGFFSSSLSLDTSPSIDMNLISTPVFSLNIGVKVFPIHFVELGQ